jgi:hypothetical protein
MFGFLEILARLPWKKIGTALAGAALLAFLAFPWIGWSSAKKTRDKAIAEKAVVERELAESRASEQRAIANRERIQAVADDLRTSFDELGFAGEELRRVLSVAERGAREIAMARNELESLAASHASLVSQAENLDVCQTYELALREIGEGIQ